MRGYIAIALVAAGAAGLAACDSKDEGKSQPTTAAETEEAAAKTEEQTPKPEPTTVAPIPDPTRAEPPAERLSDDPEVAPPPGSEAETAAIDPAPGPSAKLFTVEAKSPAVKGGKLAQHVGFGLPGGRMAPVLMIGCKAPCWSPAPMWPSATTETSLEFTLFRHVHAKQDGATALGKYTVSSIPLPKSGKHTEVLLGLGAVDGAIVMHAKLKDGGDPLPIATSR